LFCYVGDILAFLQDSQSKESRFLSATQRKNLLALCKLIQFVPSSAAPATVSETFSIPAPVAGDVTIPSGSFVKTADVVSPVRFQTLSPIVILAGATSASGIVENSESWLEQFTATGRANQDVLLGRSPFIDHTATVADGGGAYTEVLNFLDSGPSSRHYVVTVDQNGKATLRFGNGVNGCLPSGTISVLYKTGGGAAGNVAIGAINTVEGSYTDSFGTPVSVSATNALASSGGANRMTMAMIKLLAPPSVRVAGRTVAKEDYEINARAVPGVARALMVTSNEVVGIDENTGRLYIIPTGGGVPSSALKAAVHTAVTATYPNTLTFQVTEHDPIYLTVNIHTVVYLKPGYTAATVKAAIETALASFFAVSLADGTPNPLVDFGMNMKQADGSPANEIALSDVANAIRDVAGVRKIDDAASGLLLNDEHSDLAVGAFEFPQLGTVEIINGDTGLPL
jgi:hypothetical protein